MKVIIAGSRTLTNPDNKHRRLVCETMAKFPHPVTEVVSGRANGADLLGEAWAKDHSIPVKPFPYPSNAGRSGGPIRNGAMARYADALVAFRDYGASRGTDDMISQAKKNNLLVWVVYPSGNIRVFAPQDDLFAK